jgi:hypothetical protein
MTEYGVVPWNTELGSKSTNRDNSDFIKLKSGENTVRILTQPYQYWYHSYKEREEDPGFGTKIKCSLENGECPLCDEGVKRKRKWYIGIIDRDTETYKILDMAWGILLSLQKYSEDTRWGDPRQYDINIVVDKTAGAQGYYTVLAIPHSPLSKEDEEIKENIDLEVLDRLCAPPTVDKVLTKIKEVKERMAKKRKNKEGSNKEKSKTRKNTQSKKEEKDEEGQFDFPAVE